jgi:hypothetical protein
MKNKSLILGGVAATLMAFSAAAVPITGGISLAGGPVAVNSGDNLSTATAIINFGTVAVTGSSGTYATLNGGIPNFTPVTTTTGFTFLPTLSPNPTVNVWSFVYLGNTYSFDLSSIQSVSQGFDVNGNQFLDISGKGTLHITGFTDTIGSYIFTANSASDTFSFSSSNGAVPDGGTTVMLLGAAFAGLALLRKKLVTA